MTDLTPIGGQQLASHGRLSAAPRRRATGRLSIPQGDPADSYSAALTMDVGSLQPSRGALEAACRWLRTTPMFRPKISEVLAAVREAGIMYETALRALDDRVLPNPDNSCATDTSLEFLLTNARRFGRLVGCCRQFPSSPGCSSALERSSWG